MALLNSKFVLILVIFSLILNNRVAYVSTTEIYIILKIAEIYTKNGH